MNLDQPTVSSMNVPPSYFISFRPKFLLYIFQTQILLRAKIQFHGIHRVYLWGLLYFWMAVHTHSLCGLVGLLPVTLACNVIILTDICINCQLYTYILLPECAIHFWDLLYSGYYPWNVFQSPHSPTRHFHFNCATYFYLTFVGNKYVLLMAMGYDHYIAIYNPLWYSVIMGKKTCIQLANISWSIGQSTANIQVSSVFSLPFCDTNIISCIFCDIWPSVKLFCADITIKKCITLFINLCVLGLTMILIFISYVLIVTTILKITSAASAQGRKKPFPACALYLTVVIVHHGCTSFI